jgi:uncharacterized protein (TIGR03067 family)
VEQEVVYVWDNANPVPELPPPIQRRVLAGPFTGVASVAFRPDGKALAASFCNLHPKLNQVGRAGRIRIWTLSTSAKPARKQAKTDGGGWKERKVLDLPGWLGGSLAYSPDGKALAVGGSGGRVAVYDTATWNNPWARVLGGKFSAVAYSWDGETVAATVPDGVRLLSKTPIFNVPPPKDGTEKWKNWYEEQLTEKGSQPTAVAFFPETRVDNTNLRQHKVIFGSARGHFVKTWLEWPKVSTITAQTVPEGKQPADLYAVPLAVDPHGKRVVVTGPIDRATGKSVLWAWSAGSGAGNALLEGHKATVTAAAWSKDGKALLTGDTDGVIIQWDGTTFKEKRRLQLRGRVASLALTADGDRAAAAVAGLPLVMDEQLYYEDVFVWPTESLPAKPTPIARHQVGGAFNGIASVAFSPDGKSLAATFCNFDQLDKLNELVGKVRIWTLAGGQTPATPKSGGIGGKSSKYKHDELEKFQGVWRLDQFDGPSGKLTAGEVKKLDWTMTFNGNKYQLTQRGEVTNYGRIAVDTIQNPPVLIRISTDRDRDGYVWCLYEIEGDTLRLCQETLGKGRPTEFKVTPSQTIAVYKRQRP